MWDLKPDAPAEIRGEFKPIKTNVPGIQICELFPKLAAMMDKLVVVRSIVDARGPALCRAMHVATARSELAVVGRMGVSAGRSGLSGNPAQPVALLSNQSRAVGRPGRWRFPRRTVRAVWPGQQIRSGPSGENHQGTGARSRASGPARHLVGSTAGPTGFA